MKSSKAEESDQDGEDSQQAKKKKRVNVNEVGVFEEGNYVLHDVEIAWIN